MPGTDWFKEITLIFASNLLKVIFYQSSLRIAKFSRLFSFTAIVNKSQSLFMSVNSILDWNDNFAAKVSFKCQSLPISFVGAVDTILPNVPRFN